MAQQTTKKVKYVGTHQFIDAETGELKTMQVSDIEERDFNFHKVWMRNFISTLDLVGNQKTKLAFWIIDNLNKDNQLICTYRQIADKTGISLDTVRITMKVLLDADFLRKVNNGCYVVNPDIVFKGERGKRLNILNQFHDSEHIEMSDEERLSNIMQSISAMQKTMDKLVKEANKLQEKISKEPALKEGVQESFVSTADFDQYVDKTCKKAI